MSKHTPGPWCQDKWGSLMTEGGQDVLLRGITTISAGSDERIAEAEANTRLISAAPELLEALQVCIQQITALCSADDVPDQARAAIAKATA
ncbi:hypothetical protein FA389_08020 [Pseudomonas aeruginosa]|nr:hypothetical protein [Pseudomonas aeruginosa]MCO2658762.1 hypothetical protein [Pseudomonas aeruginosa]